MWPRLRGGDAGTLHGPRAEVEDLAVQQHVRLQVASAEQLLAARDSATRDRVAAASSTMTQLAAITWNVA